MSDQLKVELQDSFGSDRTIAEAAWTSSLDYQKKKTRSEQDVKRVVELLATQCHATPFESVVFRFWIKMPIAIDRQFMTHRLQSASGMSARYRTMPREYLDIPEDVETITNKIKLSDVINLTNGSIIFGLDSILDRYYSICEFANNSYSQIVDILKQSEKDKTITNQEFKRLREFYRGILPQHNMTERVSTMNLRSFANFQKLRNSEHAQPEIRTIAQKMLEEVKKANCCPIAIEWLEKNGWKL